MNDPSNASALLISRLSRADLEAVRAILEPSDLHVDLEAELERAIALPWVGRAKPDEPPVAFLLAWSVADELHLLELATLPEQRRRGHARALLLALLSRARSDKKRLILLEVRQSNLAAITLYGGCGFRATGVRRAYYADTGEDAVEMRITLDPDSGEIVANDV